MSSADLTNGWPSIASSSVRRTHPGSRGSAPSEQRSELGDAGARAGRERRSVERAERRHLAHADEAVVALEHDDRRVGAVLGLVAAAVRAVAERLPLP